MQGKALMLSPGEGIIVQLCNTCHVMVVEDDAGVRESIADVLRDQGYTVAEAGDGEQALTALENGIRPCLLLLDLMMPRMDGPAFWAIQQNDPALAKIPIVLMSASRELESTAQLLRVDRILKKPIGLADLMGTVSFYCAPHRLDPSA